MNIWIRIFVFSFFAVFPHTAMAQWQEYFFQLHNVAEGEFLDIKQEPHEGAKTIGRLPAGQQNLILHRCEINESAKDLKTEFLNNKIPSSWVSDWPFSSWLHLEGSRLSKKMYDKIKRNRWCSIAVFGSYGDVYGGWVKDTYLQRYGIAEWHDHEGRGGYSGEEPPDLICSNFHPFERWPFTVEMGQGWISELLLEPSSPQSCMWPQYFIHYVIGLT